VSMASSGTNMYSYNVWVYGVMLVIASNKWWADLEGMGWDDREWLELNSVYAHVTEKLY
jgi:hypothetical protein